MALEARGAEVLTVPDGRIASALRQLGDREIAALLLEGGAGIHAAAWDEGVVDFVRLYVTPHSLGDGVPLLPDRAFASTALLDRRVATMGPDILIEGYVHRAD